MLLLFARKSIGVFYLFSENLTSSFLFCLFFLSQHIERCCWISAELTQDLFKKQTPAWISLLKLVETACISLGFCLKECFVSLLIKFDFQYTSVNLDVFLVVFCGIYCNVLALGLLASREWRRGVTNICLNPVFSKKLCLHATDWAKSLFWH